MVLRRRACLFFAASLLVLLSVGVASAGRFSPAPANPEYVEYMEAVKRGERPLGEIPSPVDLSHLSNEPIKSAIDGKGDTTPPEKYDIVPLGWTSPVKNQRRWGTCWDFATMEAIESNWKKENNGEQILLSELHLGYFAYTDYSDSLPGYTRMPVQSHENVIFDQGGHVFVSRAILSRGTGPILESDAEYPDFATPEEWRDYDPADDPNIDLYSMPSRYRLKESLVYTGENRKIGVMTDGACYLSFKAFSAKDYELPTYVFWNGETEDPNDPSYSYGGHAVTLVGWDDTVPTDKFVSPVDKAVPNAPGAWKIQNSWGEDAGEDGFYWISYEDKAVAEDGQIVSSFAVMPVEEYDNSYFHDELGICIDIGVKSDSYTVANVFKAKSDEELVYVGFDTINNNLAYEIQVYVDLLDSADPTSGTKVWDVPQTGVADVAGYRAVKLAESVGLPKGATFSVVLTAKANVPDSKLKLPLEANTENSDKAFSKSGESFLWDEDGWIEPSELDFGDSEVNFYTNVTVKAFTKDGFDFGSSSSSSCATGVGLLALVLVGAAVIKKR